MSYRIGIDIGGTNIACGIVNEKYEIIARSKVKTNAPRPYEEILEDIKKSVYLACKELDIAPSEAESIGIGCPGTCNSEGVVEYSNNLGFVNVPLKNDIEKEFGVKTYLDNDANAAALGEYLAGAAKGAVNAVAITLGTGVGAGIIINGRIYSGSNCAGGEIGHTVIEVDGRPCTCGRKGCFEAYSSATGLVNMTREAAEREPSSVMNDYIREDGKVSARTAYKAMKNGDPAGKAVTEQYVKYLACGIANTINIFQPDILCIGGGVCNEGDTLLVPLRKAVAEQVYSRNSAKNTEIVVCSLGNDAGIIGAAGLGAAE
ncbi:MAG: ROK family protein [Oscillospiraceae bacterium]|nr:ROK family protein [Oscillospiraceae bacterium]